MTQDQQTLTIEDAINEPALVGQADLCGFAHPLQRRRGGLLQPGCRGLAGAVRSFEAALQARRVERAGLEQ